MKIARCLVFAILFLSMLHIGCGRRYAKGEYISPDTIILRSDKFVEADLQIIAGRLTDSLLASPSFSTGGKSPAILISKFTNSTDEHIDMQSISEKIMVILQKSGKARLINVKMRDVIEGEHEYREAGFIDPETAKRRGKQIGAHYLISGNIASIKQPVGRQEIVYYKATLELTDLGTNIIAWMDDVEIKKKFRKRYTGF